MRRLFAAAISGVAVVALWFVALDVLAALDLDASVAIVGVVFSGSAWWHGAMVLLIATGSWVFVDLDRKRASSRSRSPRRRTVWFFMIAVFCLPFVGVFASVLLIGYIFALGAALVSGETAEIAKELGQAPLSLALPALNIAIGGTAGLAYDWARTGVPPWRPEVLEGGRA